MKVARILYPVHTLGPGERLAIWTYGCNHGCPGCANPELWNPKRAKETDASSLRAYLEQLKGRGPIEGITITGGDPFLDMNSLKNLLGIVREYSEDILVYTGFLFDEIKKENKAEEILADIAVLIDGPYIEAQNKGHVLKGSENQTIYYLKKQYEESYKKYIAENQGKYLVENFPANGGVISVGIHKPDFKQRMDEILLGGKNE